MASRNVNRLIFLENQAQVSWVRHSNALGPKDKLIAVTADALQLLEQYGLPHDPIAIYDNSVKMSGFDEQNALKTYGLAVEVESYIGKRYKPADFEGPGFLSGQAKYLQIGLSIIATRTFLISRVLQACKPDVVIIFEDGVIPWYSNENGYIRNPWLDIILDMSSQQGFSCEKILLSPTSGTTKTPDVNWFQFLVRRCPQAVWRRSVELFKKSLLQKLTPLTDLRLLIVDADWYDWLPVLNALERTQGFECFCLKTTPANGNIHQPFYAFRPQLKRRSGRLVCKFEVGSPLPDLQETHQLGELFDRWLEERSNPPTLDFLGIELFSAWKTYFRILTQYGPALLRYNDTIAHQTFKSVKPDATCVFSCHNLAISRMAHHSRKNSVPVVCYQHGGSYGTHNFINHELTDFTHSDYFLTYGSGIQPPSNPISSVRAKFLPVGSTRVEAMKTKLVKHACKKCLPYRKVLWIADFPSLNLYGAINGDIEDTTRYLLQKECLRSLNNAKNMQVTYRPYKGRMSMDGTSNWIKQAKLSSVEINTTQRLDALICDHDLIVSDNHSATIWNEVIGLRKPFILYCNLSLAPLKPSFIPDLARSCYWCKSEAAFRAAIERLVNEQQTVIEELKRIDPTDYINKYILRSEDGHCVQRVISFLNIVCKQRRPIKDWERTIEK